MTKDEALKMAIEALQKNMRYAGSKGLPYPDMVEALQACKDALNEQSSAQEPVAWLYEDELPSTYPYDVMFKYSAIRDGVRMFPIYVPKHKNNKTPLEQAEKDDKTYKVEVSAPSWQGNKEFVGLSDDEIWDVIEKMGERPSYQETARAIEAKLKEKNNAV